jgi:hypothetical protein
MLAAHTGAIMGSATEPKAIPLTEPIAIPDTLASGLARAETHGTLIHFILFSEHSDADGNPERVICARIVMPKEAVPAAIRVAIAAVSNDFIDRRLPGVFQYVS